ncbi:MAG: hypothetical protein M1830_000362 [Pleopsidium flavum]|nr:MAG: hypothetical protein M1830_000362 [Pleopsidium flavum]
MPSGRCTKSLDGSGIHPQDDDKDEESEDAQETDSVVFSGHAEAEAIAHKAHPQRRKSAFVLLALQMSSLPGSSDSTSPDLAGPPPPPPAARKQIHCGKTIPLQPDGTQRASAPIALH